MSDNRGGMLDHAEKAAVSQLVKMVTTAVTGEVLSGARSGSSVSSLTANVIELTCIVEKGISNDQYNNYCKSIESQLGVFISSLIMNGNIGGNIKSIMSKMPVLSPLDFTYINKINNSIQTVGKFSLKRLTSEKKNAGDVFFESYMDHVEKGYSYALERSDEIIVSASRDSGPTFIDVPRYDAGIDKNTGSYRIGIRVTPKIVESAEIESLIIKKNMNTEVSQKGNMFFNKLSKVKNVLTGKLKGIKNDNDAGSEVTNAASNLYTQMERVKDVKKPFIYILMTGDTQYNLKEEHNIDISSSAVLTKLYSMLPILGIAILQDSGLLSYSLCQENRLIEKPFEEFINGSSKLTRDAINAIKRESIYRG